MTALVRHPDPPIGGSGISDPFRTYPSAAGKPLRCGRADLPGFVEESVQTTEAQAVDDLTAAALGGHEPAVTQAGEMGADAGLCATHLGRQIVDGALARVQSGEKPKPSGVGEDAKEAGQGGCVREEGCLNHESL